MQHLLKQEKAPRLWWATPYGAVAISVRGSASPCPKRRFWELGPHCHVGASQSLHCTTSGGHGAKQGATLRLSTLFWPSSAFTMTSPRRLGARNNVMSRVSHEPPQRPSPRRKTTPPSQQAKAPSTSSDWRPSSVARPSTERWRFLFVLPDSTFETLAGRWAWTPRQGRKAAYSSHSETNARDSSPL